jgi:hypothetical protein
MVPDATTAASGGSLLFDQYRPFAILEPKNRKTTPMSVVGDLCFNACFSQLEPKPPSGGQTKKTQVLLFLHPFFLLFFLF